MEKKSENWHAAGKEVARVGGVAYFKNKNQKVRAYAFLAIVAIVLAAFVIAGLWILRTDQTAQTILIATLMSVPMAFGLMSILSRSHKIEVEDTWSNISYRSVVRFLQIYVVAFLAVTVAAYFELNFVVYLTDFILCFIMLLLIWTLSSRYRRRNNTQKA